MNVSCSIEDCDKVAHARGWCTTHYQRWRTHGDPTLGARVPRNVDLCSVDGCVKAQKVRGYCDAHWARWRKYGDPLGLATEVPLVERFWRHVDKNGPVAVVPWSGDVLEEPCWLWTGSQSAGGYGVISIANQMRYAHRLSHELFVGEIPDRLAIDHLCAVRACVNPSHFEMVSTEENSRRGVVAREWNREKVRNGY